MKRFKKLSGFLLSLGLLALQFTPVMAAEQAYTYTVRFFSGAQGTIDGEEMVVYQNLQDGDRVTFNQRSVTLNDDSKYYIKGIRESGKDNNTANGRSSFSVSSDMDYVVVYGLLTDAVAYTINYVDQDGNTLAPSETYYGNVGDAPVIAYLYIEGYQPQAYNLTGVLQRNAADNVFNFVYRRIDTGTPGGGEPENPTAAPAGPTAGPQTQPTAAPTAPTTAPAGTPSVQGPAPATAIPAPGTAGTAIETTQNEGTGGDAAAAEGGQEGEDANADADAADAAGDEAAAEDGEPAELQQIGDEEVPLANLDNDGSNLFGLNDDFARRIGDFPLAAKIGICSATLLAVGVAAWLLLIRNRKKQIEIE